MISQTTADIFILAATMESRGGRVQISLSRFEFIIGGGFGVILTIYHCARCCFHLLGAVGWLGLNRTANHTLCHTFKQIGGSCASIPYSLLALFFPEIVKHELRMVFDGDVL